MKLKFFATLGILSFTCYMQAQNVPNNPPPQMAPGVTTDYANHFGIGAQFGEPFGINAKYWLNDFMALDGAAGWSPAAHSAAEIHADFLVHDFDLLTPPEGRAAVYIGGGILGRFRTEGRSDLAGWRFPLGVSYMFDNCPVDIFAEVAPEVIFAPFVRGGISGTVGFRFWF
jgi:hypothetical protein